MEKQDLTFCDFAFRVLSLTGKPMTPAEIWNCEEGIARRERIKTSGKTPCATLGAQLYTDVKKENSRFVGVGARPVRFALKNAPKTCEAVVIPEPPVKKAFSFLEKDLHPLLVWFAFEEFSACCKTILHNKSTKNSTKHDQWFHPDIVGVSLVAKGWKHSPVDLMKKMGGSLAKFYSFELKRSLDFGTLREYFFQAVSNSSWANEGYLVVAKLDESPDFMEELRRLSQSFGIGVIKLDLESMEDSEVLLPAREKTELDWETINRLVELNPIFENFVTLASESIELNKIVNETHFDKVEETDTIIEQARKLLGNSGN